MTGLETLGFIIRAMGRMHQRIDILHYWNIHIMNMYRHAHPNHKDVHLWQLMVDSPTMPVETYTIIRLETFYCRFGCRTKNTRLGLHKDTGAWKKRLKRINIVISEPTCNVRVIWESQLGAGALLKYPADTVAVEPIKIPTIPIANMLFLFLFSCRNPTLFRLFLSRVTLSSQFLISKILSLVIFERNYDFYLWICIYLFLLFNNIGIKMSQFSL